MSPHGRLIPASFLLARTSLSSSTTFGLLTNTRNGSGAPGIGAGEPLNVQLAAKILF